LTPPFASRGTSGVGCLMNCAASVAVIDIVRTIPGSTRMGRNDIIDR